MHNFFMYIAMISTGKNTLLIFVDIKTGNVVSDGTCEQLVILEHAGNAITIIIQADRRYIQPINQNMPCEGVSSPAITFINVVFPIPDGPVIATLSPAST